MYRRLLAEDQVYGRHSISYKEDEEDDGTDDDDYNDKTIFWKNFKYELSSMIYAVELQFIILWSICLPSYLTSLPSLSKSISKDKFNHHHHHRGSNWLNSWSWWIVSYHDDFLGYVFKFREKKKKKTKGRENNRV